MSHTLLIADHHQDFVDALGGELAADGYATLTACSPTALALTLTHNRAELIVLGDFEGPGAQARLLAELRAARSPFPPAAADTPAVVVSEHDGQLARLRCFDASIAP